MLLRGSVDERSCLLLLILLFGYEWGERGMWVYCVNYSAHRRRANRRVAVARVGAAPPRRRGRRCPTAIRPLLSAAQSRLTGSNSLFSKRGLPASQGAPRIRSPTAFFQKGFPSCPFPVITDIFRKGALQTPTVAPAPCQSRPSSLCVFHRHSGVGGR